MKVIINADDFGISEQVNQAIVQCFKKGYITHTTLMPNMPYARQAVELAIENNFIDKVGIHINLYEGQAMNPKLCGFKEFGGSEQGILYGEYRRKMFTRFFLRKKVRAELREELKRQIDFFIQIMPEYVIEKGIHIDTHGHSHTNWCIWKELKKVLNEYNVRSIRLSLNVFNKKGECLKRIYKKMYNSKLKRNYITTDYFCSFEDFAHLTAKNKEHLKNSSIELMCHPQYKNGLLVNNTPTGFEEIMEKCEKEVLTSFGEIE